MSDHKCHTCHPLAAVAVEPDYAKMEREAWARVLVMLTDARTALKGEAASISNPDLWMSIGISYIRQWGYAYRNAKAEASEHRLSPGMLPPGRELIEITAQLRLLADCLDSLRYDPLPR